MRFPAKLRRRAHVRVGLHARAYLHCPFTRHPSASSHAGCTSHKHRTSQAHLASHIFDILPLRIVHSTAAIRSSTSRSSGCTVCVRCGPPSRRDVLSGMACRGLGDALYSVRSKCFVCEDASPLVRSLFSPIYVGEQRQNRHRSRRFGVHTLLAPRLTLLMGADLARTSPSRSATHICFTIPGPMDVRESARTPPTLPFPAGFDSLARNTSLTQAGHERATLPRCSSYDLSNS